ncbi:hypothetical protein N6L25_09975 [Marinobacter sp. SS21]|nr:hypothetical protein [Marinobacter sp. SS21]MDC0662891.1 hypothetical protein [Marinobacter sp. SS21]
MAGLLGPVVAQAEEAGAEVFEFRERSTMDTIRLRSLAEESLANTVIEGGLEAPASGVAVAPQGEEDYYLDPLALQPNDGRTDLGRSEIPVDIRFSNPRAIPGQTHSNTYSIQPPANRAYQAYGASISER